MTAATAIETAVKKTAFIAYILIRDNIGPNAKKKPKKLMVK